MKILPSDTSKSEFASEEKYERLSDCIRPSQHEIATYELLRVRIGLRLYSDCREIASHTIKMCREKMFY